MKAYWIFLIVFLSTLTLGAGYLILSGSETVFQETSEDCAALLSAEEKDSCYLSLAEDSKNVSVCLSIQDTWKKRDCIDILQ